MSGTTDLLRVFRMVKVRIAEAELHGFWRIRKNYFWIVTEKEQNTKKSSQNLWKTGAVSVPLASNFMTHFSKFDLLKSTFAIFFPPLNLFFDDYDIVINKSVNTHIRNDS